MIPASRLAIGCVLPFATATSICRRMFTICSGVCFLALPISGFFHTNLSHLNWYRLCRALHNTGEVKILVEPKETEAHSARRAYTMWPVSVADHHPVGGMQVTETTQFHPRAIAVNEQLLLSGMRQYELRETAEKQQ